MVTYGNESYHIEAMAFKRANSGNKIYSYCKQSDGKNNSKENYLPYLKRTEKNGRTLHVTGKPQSTAFTKNS